MAQTKSKGSFSKESSLALKGVGILLLMCIHSFGETGRFKGFEIDFSPFTAEVFVDFCAYTKICVAIFAFISGYGLYLSGKKKCLDSKSTSTWLIDRYFKTFSGFWFVYIISFVVTQILVQLPEKKYFTDGMFRGVAYAFIDFIGISDLFETPSMNGSWWYMTTAFLFIIITPIVCMGEKKMGLIGVCLSLIVIPRLITDSEFYGKSGAYSFLIAYLLGALFARYEIFDKLEEINIKGNKTAANLIMFVIMLGALVVSYMVWHRVPVKKVWEFHYGLAPLIVIVFCQKFVFKVKFITKILMFFGKHSMNIFFFHTFLRVNLLKEFLYGLGTPWKMIPALFFISLAISIIFEFIKKLIKYDNLIDKISKKVTEAVQ